MKEYNNIDSIFKESLIKREISPKKDSWEKLNASLNREEKSNLKFKVLLTIAASLLLFIITYNGLFTPKTNVIVSVNATDAKEVNSNVIKQELKLLNSDTNTPQIENLTNDKLSQSTSGIPKVKPNESSNGNNTIREEVFEESEKIFISVKPNEDVNITSKDDQIDKELEELLDKHINILKNKKIEEDFASKLLEETEEVLEESYRTKFYKTVNNKVGQLKAAFTNNKNNISYEKI